ncbi:MAG: Gfo/Idh/MocA family oxidoreductase [Thermoguttaceae bacterium]
MPIKPTTNRRQFLKTTGVLAVSAGLFSCPAFARDRKPNSKLNLLLIGTSGMQGEFHRNSLANENIIALCDVDDTLLHSVGEKYPDAKRYNDFRVMYDELAGKADAVLVTTPDHTHAVAALGGMKQGLHCYCEKPLARTIHEIRTMTQVAKEKNLITQMGTQIHAGDNYRRVVELIEAGAIGPVEEVHVWCGARWGNQTMPTEFPEVPANLHWDLWLGPAKHRPYHPVYFGGNWRSFWAFGNGTLGDMGCHHIDLPFWALKLKYPLSVESSAPTEPDLECTPADMVAKYQFPKRGDLPAVSMTWYDGEKRPALLAEKNLPNWGAGTLFVGKEGMLLADYGRHLLFPEEKFSDYEYPARSIPKSVGHHTEWIEAIKAGKGPTTCDFSYSGPVAETVLLGTLAYRLGKKLDWDGEGMKVTNVPESASLITAQYPDDWKLL